MILYHGTTLEIKNPEIIKSEIGRDFGFAFYTTSIKEQAERWALRRAKIQSRRDRICIQPIVNVYEWKNTNQLQIKTFTDASIEWLELVVKCRSELNFRHNYDIVIGKIADDNVGETVSYVIQGIMRKEDAVNRLKFEQINDQIAFCTQKSLSELTFLKSYTLEDKVCHTQL